MPYTELRPSTSRFTRIRGLNHHLRCWGDESLVSPERPPLLLMHGWMDVAASFQFVVDAMAAAEGATRFIVAADWRGFGLTDTPAADTYWLPDYVADLDALADSVSPGRAVDLLGHSMGGNVVMTFAGLRPARIRKLINLEGFGLPRTQPAMAPKRLLQWLDELKEPATLRSYDSLAGVAERLMKNNPRLSHDKAVWLAPHWSALRDGPGEDGRWHILGDPAHKRVNPVLYQVDEVLAIWQQISAPLLWVEGDQTDMKKWWGDRFPRSDFDARLATVANVHKAVLSPCGHMLHHDQPEALAAQLLAFLA